METSSFEDIGEKKLYTILYFMKQYLNGNKITHNSIEDSEILESIESASKLVFQKSRNQLDYIDIDFLSNLYILNFDKINGPKDFVELTIPQVKNYSFDIETDENERVLTTYRHTMSSYSKHSVSPIIELYREDGNLDYWDGKMVNREVVDSDFNDVNILWKSLQEVSPKK
jgi:hypothetical protein